MFRALYYSWMHIPKLSDIVPLDDMKRRYSISEEKWDEIAKTWVITTLKAPADQVSTDVIDKLGLKE